MNEDAHFLYTSALTKTEDYIGAYEAIRYAVACLDMVHDDLMTLHGLICIKLKPALYNEALDIFSALIQRKPDNMDAVS